MLSLNNWISKKTHQQTIDINNKFWKDLKTDAYPATKGKYTLPISLELQHICTRDHLYISQLLFNFVRSLQLVADAYFVDDYIKQIITLSDIEKKIITKTKDQPYCGPVRVDMFMTDKPNVIEVNTDFPDGFFMHDVTINKLAKINNKEVLINLHTKQFNTLLHKLNIKKDAHIFIGFNADRIFTDEFYLSKNMLQEMGWVNISVAPFDDVTYKDNHMYYDNKKIDVVRRGVEISKIEQSDFIKYVLETPLSFQPIIINNFKQRLLGHKSLMAALHDKQVRTILNKKQKEAVDILLPKTMAITNETYNQAIVQKDAWVLKPNNLAEGEGVYIGINTNQDSWQTALDIALKNKSQWILQQYVVIPKQNIYLFDNETINVQQKYIDFNPHIMMYPDETIEMGHILNRFSDDKVLNVMKGGGIGYSLVEYIPHYLQ